VKIRGYRIELGEIEERLFANECVKDAVVLVREDTPGDKKLVAYVVLRSSEAQRMQVDELRAALKSTLPDHMLPHAIVALERFPLTPNGKLDRAALPLPADQACAKTHYEPPDGETEELLVELWRALLGVERIGRQDNFFERGGQSLTGMRLIVKVAETFSVQIPFYAIFEYPTIQEMARFIASLAAEHSNEPKPLELEEGVV
jgi:acyl carrier protein